MNRIEIKKSARDKIRNKLWDIWKPYAIMFLVAFLINMVIGFIINTGNENNIYSMIIELALYPLTVGIYGYILNFVRNKKYIVNDIWKPYKNSWNIILTVIIMVIVVFFGYVCLIIPGIILSVGYSMVVYLMADEDNSPIETLRKSRKMMKGYKMDYLTFVLSFIPWVLLVIITLGIATIYVAPYTLVANAIYYDELKKIQKKKA